jgi:hypothetical protein
MSDLSGILGRDSAKVSDLARIFADRGGEDGFVEDTIRALSLLDAEVAWRAVWLLKELAREGRLTSANVSAIAEQAEAATHWSARLNLCQLFAITGCPAAARDTLFPFLTDCLENRRPMIRAWALTVLAGFTNERRFRKPVDAALRRARADSAASVRARLRRMGEG